jgi:hypothetical protein
VPAAGLTFDLLTIVLMGGVIAMIVSTTLMVIDMMPGRRGSVGSSAWEPRVRRLSPGAARLIAQARERAALASADPGLIASQLGLDGIDPVGAVQQLPVDPYAVDTIVLPPGAVTMAPYPAHEPLALPAGPVIEVPRAPGRPTAAPLGGPVIEVPMVPAPGEKLSFYEASTLASHLASNDPDRIVDVIQQWLRSDVRVYEEDV